jgi:hypothetical protein
VRGSRIVDFSGDWFYHWNWIITYSKIVRNSIFIPSVYVPLLLPNDGYAVILNCCIFHRYCILMIGDWFYHCIDDRTSHRSSRDNTDGIYNSSEFQRSRRYVKVVERKRME